MSERAERLQIEPTATKPEFDSAADIFQVEIEHSKAISLKRIADAICGDERKDGIIHAIFDMVRDRP